jgi:hypothetical protein
MLSISVNMACIMRFGPFRGKKRRLDRPFRAGLAISKRNIDADGTVQVF